MKNDSQKDQFYFEGKYFSNQEDMFEYVKEWQKMPIDQETADRILDRLKKDIRMNVFLRGNGFDNAGFSNYVERIFLCSMNELNKMEDEK